MTFRWNRNPVATKLSAAFLFTCLLGVSAAGQARSDMRSESLRDADHFSVKIPEFKNLEDWQERRAEIRRTLAISAGLWPEPQRTPLNPRIFDEQEADGFSVAKVYFESLPGFFVTGNLYRPTGGEGPYPAVLTPHGHWQYGRLQNGETGSIVARCIDFARMGFVTLSIDMVGYNDSLQLPHDSQKSRAQLRADTPLPYEPRLFRGEFDFPRAQFHGLSLGGLQLWNGVRALDFLSSLPEVDDKRIGVTGASGGATQTLLLMALDERVRAAAPVNIIGVAKHPGCRCENIPGLWIETSTLELTATFAPRPLLLVSATQDPWTNSTPTREYPMLQKYYRLFGADKMIRNVHVNAAHNYNAESRAGVYKWFSEHLNSPNPPVENPMPLAADAASLGDLRVFPDHLLPEEALSAGQILANWIHESESRLQAVLPGTSHGLGSFRTIFGEALRLVLSVEVPQPDHLESEVVEETVRGAYEYRREYLGREGRGDWFDLESARPPESRGIALLVYPENGLSLIKEDGTASIPEVNRLLEQRFQVFRVRGFASEALKTPKQVQDQYSWHDAYNRSNRLEGIQDILTAVTRIRSRYPSEELTLVGLSRAGLPAFFAAALHSGAHRVVIDLDGSNPAYEGELMELLPVCALGRIGGLKTPLLLLSDRELTLFNGGPDLEANWFQEPAGKLGFTERLRLRLDSRSLTSALAP